MPFEGIQLGRYHLLRILGSGGMGEVYLADDTRIRRQVAIKVVRGEAAPYPNSEVVRRAAQLFEREMKTISKLDHPHILQLYDYGEEEINGSPVTYMVMPYRPEGSLSNWLRERSGSGLLDPQDVAAFIVQAAGALQHAHDNQIIHQDVKPSNFLIRSRPEQPQRPDVLLTDFGIARFTSSTSKTSQTIRGTPAYMAPEQWEGHPNFATDQYALAIMAYELLVGRLPFDGGPGPMMYKHLTVQPEPPSHLNPSLPAEVDSVLLHALAKKPEERFVTVVAFANALQQAVLSDLPTIMQSQGRLQNQAEEIRATLTISADEALMGSSRTLTIRGQQVSVTIPRNVQEGQILRVPNWNSRGGNSSLILTLAIDATELPTISTGRNTIVSPSERPTPPLTEEQLETRISNPDHMPTRLSSSAANQAQQPVVLPPMGRGQTTEPPIPHTMLASDPIGAGPNQGMQSSFGYSGNPPGNWTPGAGTFAAPPVRKRRSPALTFLLVLLILLLVLGSGTLLYFTVLHPGSGGGGTPDANLTATQSAANADATQAALNQGNTNATATAADVTATAQADANAANSTATATAQAQADANATATAQAQAQANANASATAQAQANANATATVLAQKPPLSIDKTTVTASLTADTADCVYSSSVAGSGNPGWGCAVVLKNIGYSDINWTYNFTLGSTGNTPPVATILGGADALFNPQSGGGYFASPPSGTIHPGQSQTVTVAAADFNNRTVCPSPLTFSFNGPGNSVTTRFSCS